MSNFLLIRLPPFSLLLLFRILRRPPSLTVAGRSQDCLASPQSEKETDSTKQPMARTTASLCRERPMVIVNRLCRVFWPGANHGTISRTGVLPTKEGCGCTLRNVIPGSIIIIINRHISVARIKIEVQVEDKKRRNTTRCFFLLLRFFCISSFFFFRFLRPTQETIPNNN